MTKLEFKWWYYDIHHELLGGEALDELYAEYLHNVGE